MARAQTNHCVMFSGNARTARNHYVPDSRGDPGGAAMSAVTPFRTRGPASLVLLDCLERVSRVQARRADDTGAGQGMHGELAALPLARGAPR